MQVKMIIAFLKIETKKTIAALNNLPKQVKTIGAFLIILSAFLLYESLLSGQLLKLKALRQELISKKKLFLRYDELVKNDQAIEKEMQDTQERLSRMRSNFVSEQELSKYFASFRELVKSYNLQIISLDFKPQEEIQASADKKLAHFQVLPFSFSLKGNYFDTMLLLYKLQQTNPLLDIESMRLQQGDENSYNIETEAKAKIAVLVKGK